jgi:hypothetical protein
MAPAHPPSALATGEVVQERPVGHAVGAVLRRLQPNLMGDFDLFPVASDCLLILIVLNAPIEGICVVCWCQRLVLAIVISARALFLPLLSHADFWCSAPDFSSIQSLKSSLARHRSGGRLRVKVNHVR